MKQWKVKRFDTPDEAESFAQKLKALEVEKHYISEVTITYSQAFNKWMVHYIES